jgi:hypothetical protein
VRDPLNVTAKELEDAIEILRRAASSFTPSSFAGRVLQSARGILVDQHARLQASSRNRRAAAKLDDN